MMTSRVLLLGDGVVARDLDRELSSADCLVTSWVTDELPAGRMGSGLSQVIELMQTVEMRQFDVVMISSTSARELVREIVREVERRMGAEALLLASAMSLSATEIASWCARPERVVCFGFVPPLEGVAAVELARGRQTGELALRRAMSFWSSTLRREAVCVKDSAGLVMPRVVAMVINEAAFALMEGIATKAEIDTAMKLGTNYPFGPLEWADQIGVGQVVATLQGVHAEQGEDRYRPAPLLLRMRLANERFYRSEEGADDVDARGGHY